MQDKILLLILLLVLTAGLSSLTTKKFDYNAAWKEIDKLQRDGLPKSMLEKIDILYQVAVDERNTDQQIKALIYQLKTQQYTEEFSDQKAINKVEEFLAKSSFPSSSILHSMLAQLYWSYYQQNRWRYGQRTETINFDHKDIATWDLKTIAKETMEQYRMSLAYPNELQKIKIIDYPAIITKPNKEAEGLRPTLFDFLAQRALDFYINDESGLTLPFEEFTITDTKFFQPAASFVKMTLTSPDSLSLKYQALVLFQDLIRFHLDDKDPSALVDVNLDRLDFVYRNCSIDKPETHYESALRLEESKYKDYPVSTYATFKIASLIRSLGDLYRPDTSEQYKWNYKMALELCKQAMKAYPESFGARSCKALSDQITMMNLGLTIENIVIPNSPVKALLNIKNLDKVYVRIYRIKNPNIGSDDFDEYNYRDWSDKKKLAAQLAKPYIWSKTFTIPDEGDYRQHSMETALKELPAGRYLIISSDDFNKDINNQHIGYSEFSSSNLSYITLNSSSGTMLISNRSTGFPKPNVTVKTYRREYNKLTKRYNIKLSWTGKTDTKGIVNLPKDTNRYDNYCVLIDGSDTLYIGNVYVYNNQHNPVINSRCLLFTDRSIYRPGQTIYVKGIFYESDGEKHNKILPQKNVNVFFYDVNNQVVAQQKFLTNEYGTFNCTFTAPKGVLTGQMYINVDNIGSVEFSVEEYKRPKFEVKIEQPKETYKLDQYVNVKGTALSYAGFPIDNAEVAYRITRQPKYPYWFWWWGSMPSVPAKEIMHGNITTDEKGEFTLSFLAQGDDSVSDFGNPYFIFTISADATDISGETHSGSLGLFIGKKELVLNPEVPEKINQVDKELTIPIKTNNLSGEKISASGTVTISRLETPNHIQKSRLWSIPDKEYLSKDDFLKLFPNDIFQDEDKITNWKVLERVYTGQFNTPDVDSLLINNLDKWTQGVYVLEAVATYKQQEIKTTRYFTIYNSKSKLLPYHMADWFVPIKTTCEPGESAQVLIGSSYSDVSVLYEVEKNHKIVESKRLTLDKEQRLFTLPVTEEDRGSFYVHFTFIRYGRVYIHNQEITVPWTNKNIEFEYMTFRDKLLPGQDEEWRLKLKDYTGGKVTAELLASMYDASLDAFRSNAWYANIYGKVYQSAGWNSGNFISTANLAQVNYFHGTSFPSKSYSSLNWFGYYVSWYSNRLYSGGGALHVRGGRANEVSYSIDNMSVSDPVDGGRAFDFIPYEDSPMALKSISAPMANGMAREKTLADGIGSSGEEAEDKSEDLSGVQARSNFAETAFFYPELRTDENGEVTIVFTVPEALTRWKFRALALTKDLKIGTTENTTVTQKPLMVIPNAPRFFREGDKITFTSKITSLDETDQSGNCQLFLFDAITMAPVDKDFGLTKAQKPFAVKKGESTVLSWDLTIPFGISAVTYRVVARAGDFSDGEENTLPILTNRMLVTESLPLPVRGKSSKSFVFEKLKNSKSSTTLKNHKLTLEFTSNPAWYAVQALPYMMEYPYDCNEQIFSRFYANSIATHIANSNPRIKKVFDSWKNTPNSTALLSNLEKNEELKAVILQETPWVLDAKHESQAKQRIGLLFDLNNMANQFNASLTQLQKNQNPSGAWSWFPGMRDSWWVTQYIVEGLGHLDHLGIKAVRDDSRVWNMLKNAVDYLDRQILEDYNNIKKYGHLEDDHLGYMEMHYLYARSFFKDIKIPENTIVAVDYFKGQCDKYWLNKDIYGQGLIALALFRDDKKVTPNKIVASLKERALHNEELGMWWKDNNWGWFWYQAPIETQSLLIEVFTDITDDTISIDDMRTWLLKNKQTTNWKTTKATAEACYALLISGTEWLNTEQLAEITIGGNKIDPMKLDDTKVEAGTGYFKTSWSGSDITPQMANVSVKNPNDVAAWGALYWQYFENLDKITYADTPLKLNKKLFLERITDTGVVLDPISDKTVLQVGDKVKVRIELRSDRDMEYVHMKDMRSSGFEPINVISRYKWQDGLGYYEATGDAATNFFIEYLRKGTYVFEYPLRVTNKGDFSNGITTIQCMYAPEFTSHSEGIRVKVK